MKGRSMEFRIDNAECRNKRMFSYCLVPDELRKEWSLL